MNNQRQSQSERKIQVQVSQSQRKKNKSVSVVDEVRGIETQTIDVMLNGVVKAKLAMDTGASRTCMTKGMLLEFKKQVPILTQLLVEQVAFELGDNRIIHAEEVAFCDLRIAAKFAPITLRKAPVYILYYRESWEMRFFWVFQNRRR